MVIVCGVWCVALEIKGRQPRPGSRERARPKRARGSNHSPTDYKDRPSDQKQQINILYENQVYVEITLTFAFCSAAVTQLAPCPLFRRSATQQPAQACTIDRKQVSLASHTSQFQQRPTAETMAEECSVLVKSLQECKEEVLALCAEKHCNPILVRLAWHDAGTFNKASSEPWPRCGGANGSIRFEPEINHGANAGLSIALKLLQPIKDKHPEVGWADLIQLASAAAIEQCGGPVIDMKYGRKDATTPQCCVDEGNLPAGNAPFPDADTPQAHIRNVFYRMGFDDEGIVALSGAHTIGRAKKDRSGEGAECTRITSEGMCPRGAGVSGVGTPGGSAWTKNWLKFDNSYFSEMPDEGSDPEILKLATDKCLFTDDGFKPFARKYKDSQDAFFADYKKAHKKLSELGVVWEPEGGFTI